MQSLGRKIKNLREKKGIKQEVLAEMLGMSQSNYSRLESDATEDLPYSKIKKILNAINCSVLELEEVPTNVNNGNGSLVANNLNNSPVNETKLIEKLVTDLVETKNALLNSKNDVIEIQRKTIDMLQQKFTKN